MAKQDAKKALLKILENLSSLLKRVNHWKNGSYELPFLLSDLKPDSLDNHIKDLTNNVYDILELLKDDFKEAGSTKGHIEFKALANAKLGGKAIANPVTLFSYPPKKTPGNYWSLTMVMDCSSFSVDYDFSSSDYVSIRLNDVQVKPTIGSRKKVVDNFEDTFDIPYISMTIHIKIPTKLNLSLPSIFFEFYGFRIVIDLNFPWPLPINLKNLSISLPDWLHWPFGPIDFSLLFNAKDCKWPFAFVWPKGGCFNIDLSGLEAWFKAILKWLSGIFKLPNFSGGDMEIKYFTYAKSDPKNIPELGAIYFDFSKPVKKLLGGLSPEQLHLMLGFQRSGLDSAQLNSGFLVCTDKISTLGNKHLMLQTYVQYKFDIKKEPEFSIEHHPGFAVEIVTDKELAKKAKCEPIVEGYVKFTGFKITLTRLGLHWDKDEGTYVFYLDGEVEIILGDFIKSVDSSNLKFSFKRLGVTTDGRLVMKETWLTMDKALQARIDDIDLIGLFIEKLGYGKEDDIFWVAFSGEISLPVLGITAGVDKLVVKSDGKFELSGIKIDTEFKKILTMKGQVKWGEDIYGPLDGLKTKGFAGQLSVDIKPISLPCTMGLTYVKCTHKETKQEFIAWSFYGDVTLPKAVPICSGLSLKSVGMMVGENYIPKPKEKGIPRDKWLEQGFNNDVNNILKIPEYWTVKDNAFGLGFAIGLVSSGDDGFILNARAILVIATPGPLIMIAGKAKVLKEAGRFDMLIIYDHDDPGIAINLAFRYDVASLLSIRGMVEIYFDFDEPKRFHFYLGTPEKPVAAKALAIFDARGYLVIDSSKIAAGVMVYYGKRWDKEVIVIKAYSFFQGEFMITWNPFAISTKVALGGEIAARVFGFGFDLSLYAELGIKAPDPWYLDALIRATFSISFLFFEWSITVKLRVRWGSDGEKPSVELSALHDDKALFKLYTGSLSPHTGLLPDPNAKSQVLYLPMDGALGFQFARDVEIDDKYTNFPKLVGGKPHISINDEESELAGNFTKFHGKLKEFRIRRKGSSGAFSDVSRNIFFSWHPEEESERDKLITRDFDMGYSQFRLNDDPNAWVKLKCPKIFESDDLLKFEGTVLDFPEGEDSYVLDKSITLSCDDPSIEVKLANSTNKDQDYTLDYSDFTVGFHPLGIIPLSKYPYPVMAVRPGDKFQFGMPAACVQFSFVPDSGNPATISVKDVVSLIDNSGRDITEDQQHQISTTGNSLDLTLNTFTPPGKDFSAQDPPDDGIISIIFKVSGTIQLYPSDGNLAFSIKLWPLGALENIHRRNLERIQQQSYLKYIFEQNKDPGKNLWETGDYEVSGKTIWKTNDTKKSERDPKEFKRIFKAIEPFEKVEVQVNGKNIQVQPFEPYVRQLVPSDGMRPTYIDQLPVIAYKCNYINAMLKKADKRLCMILVDSNNEPCRHMKLIATPVPVDVEIHDDLKKIMDFSGTNMFKNTDELKEGVPELIPGLSVSDIAKAYDGDWDQMVNSIPEPDDEEAGLTGIYVSEVDRDSLMGYARSLRMSHLSDPDEESRKLAARMENSFSKRYADPKDHAVIANVAGEMVMLHISVVTGVVEYRYTNDDLALDLSKLELSECLQPGTKQELNAYERGYFRPIVPDDAFWYGLKPNTRYIAKFYCLDKDEKIGDKLPDKPEIYSTYFTTSMFGSVEDIGDLFEDCKVRDIHFKKPAYDLIMDNPDLSALKYDLFDHPDSKATKINFGMDIFRRIHNSPDIKDDGNTPRKAEEERYKLYEDKKVAIEESRKQEGLIFEGLLDTMGLALDPISGRKVVATWIRTMDESSSKGTIGLLVELPEPLDWNRTGIRIKSYKVKIEGSGIELDLFNLPKGDPSYDVTLYWVRSLDSTRLMLITKLVKTQANTPVVVVPGDVTETYPVERPVERESNEDMRREIDEYAEREEMQPLDEVRLSEQPSLMTRRNIRIGDSSMVSTMGVDDMAILDDVYSNFGQITVENISDYEVKELELEFYYLSDNYEKKGTDGSKYRAIPRLTFANFQKPMYKPGDPLGKFGTLKPIRK